MTDFLASQIGLELWIPNNRVKVTQDVIENEVVATPIVRITQDVIEAEAVAAPIVRVTQDIIESDVVATPIVRVTQDVVENEVVATPLVRQTQLIIEALIVNLEVGMPAVFPELIGLGYSVNWTPKNYNMPTQAMASGAELDLALAETPLHEFELTYDVLWDKYSRPQDFKRMMGFFLRMQGNVGRFLFRNPDDKVVVRQIIGTTNGIDHVYQLKRSFGVGEDIGTEPIGYVDLTQPFHLYLDDVMQDHATYNVLTTEPVNQTVQFIGLPTAGQVITVDMSYFYYGKFSDPTMNFEKFMSGVWRLQQLIIRTCRAGT